jgi:4-hydroxythreonine-4-phosphate dehydrogenase
LTPVRLAVTLGDPRGIGADVVPAAVGTFLAESPSSKVVLVGSDEAIGRRTAGLDGVGVGGFDGTLASAGRISLDSIRTAVDLVGSGDVDGIVTGPVHKPALRAAGSTAPGQTELLQTLTGSRTVGMLMCAEVSRPGPPVRILLATTHLALRDVPEALTADLIHGQVALLDRSLRERWRIPAPTIALCALNPHASDEGMFGDEEARVLAPAVRRLRADGIEVTDPLPADTVFLRMLTGQADAVVAPYHDVGMAVFKTLAFGSGVNVTLGLPFVRTSPDHGTAFDLVGTGRADPGSTLEALRLAARLTRKAPRE